MPSSGKEVSLVSVRSNAVFLAAPPCPILVVTELSLRGQRIRAVQQLQPADSPGQPSPLGRFPESATTELVEKQEEQPVTQPGEPRLACKHDSTHSLTHLCAVIVYWVIVVLPLFSEGCLLLSVVTDR